ncbi:hypothetical protein F4677DRAFT_464299 [Hypoxylon crocopeplum]|nr:hypothetical protein F4677DRAFT_464299 [Hypoxylon crocopeplum]
MKKTLAGLITLLCWQYASASSPIATGQDASDPGSKAYPPCVHTGYLKYLVRNWRGVTHNDTTEIFDFELQANFSGYASPCHGVRSGDASSGWTPCEVHDDDAFFTAFFDFSSNDYITINHTFVCDRGEVETDPHNRLAKVISTGDGRLQIGLVDTPEGQYTGTEGDNMTIAAYTSIAHRLPKVDCSAASSHAEWDVRDFVYSAELRGGSPWVIPATVANINYDLYNGANEYLINCQAVNSSIITPADDPALLDPDEPWPCPISWRDDLIPPEAYPVTDFKFDRSSNKLTIEQEWECEGDDGNE